MRVGICTWVFGTLDLDRVAQAASALGFDGVELLADPDRYDPRQACDVLSRYGLAVLSMTPCDADPAHPDPTVRASAVDRYRRMLDFAADVGAPVLGFHGAVGRTAPIDSQEMEARLLEQSASEIAEYAEQVGVRVAVETLNRYESHLLQRASDARSFVERLGSSHVGVLLDTFHMNIEEPDPIAAVTETGGLLELIHVADSTRRGIGCGHVPFGTLFEALATIRYDGSVIAETTPSGLGPFGGCTRAKEVDQLLEDAAVSMDWLRNVERKREALVAERANDCIRAADAYNPNDQQRKLLKEDE